MIVKVRISLLDGAIREVTIPEGTMGDVLSAVMHFGQNENQQSETMPGVSVGDVIEYDVLWLVTPTGFKELTDDEYRQFMLMPKPDRVLWAYGIKGPCT